MYDWLNQVTGYTKQKESDLNYLVVVNCCLDDQDIDQVNRNVYVTIH
jgi:hypothetical protein